MVWTFLIQSASTCPRTVYWPEASQHSSPVERPRLLQHYHLTLLSTNWCSIACYPTPPASLYTGSGVTLMHGLVRLPCHEPQNHPLFNFMLAIRDPCTSGEGCIGLSVGITLKVCTINWSADYADLLLSHS